MSVTAKEIFCPSISWPATSISVWPIVGVRASNWCKKEILIQSLKR